MTTVNIKKEVLEMYLRHPYPSYTAAERRAIFPAELARYRYLGLEAVLPGARLLDVGCGTGHRVMPMAQHFGVREYVGFDHSAASLAVARALAGELAFPGVTLTEGDLFELPFPGESFDMVVSQGVLHHTSDPLRGFKELVRVCKPGGFIAIYLYNKFNHWRHNLQKARVNRLAGGDLERRFDVAYRLYGTRPLADMSPTDIASAIVRLAMLAPRQRLRTPPFRYPTAWHRFLWQLIYAVQGSGGKYSGGPALCGRKARA